MVSSISVILPLGGMIILVNGKIRPTDGKDRDFSQVFILEKKSTAINEYYVIKCDMLQALEVPEEEQEEATEISEESPAVEKTTEPSSPQPEAKEEPERVQTFIPTFAETPVEPAPFEEHPVASTITPVEGPATDATAAPVEVAAPATPAMPAMPATPAVPAAPTEAEAQPTEEVKTETVEMAAAAEAVEVPAKEEPAPEAAKEQPEKAAEPAPAPATMEKKPKKVVSHAVKSSRASQLSRRHEPKRDTKSDDGFTVVESRFTTKSKNSGSTLFVSFHDVSVNREALRQVFKVPAQWVGED